MSPGTGAQEILAYGQLLLAVWLHPIRPRLAVRGDAGHLQRGLQVRAGQYSRYPKLSNLTRRPSTGKACLTLPESSCDPASPLTPQIGRRPTSCSTTPGSRRTHQTRRSTCFRASRPPSTRRRLVSRLRYSADLADLSPPRSAGHDGCASTSRSQHRAPAGSRQVSACQGRRAVQERGGKSEY